MKFEEYHVKVMGRIPMTFQFLHMDECVYVYVGDLAHCSTGLFHCISTPYEKLPLCSILACDEETSVDQEDETISLMAKRITKKTGKMVTFSKGFQIDKKEMTEFYYRIEKIVTDYIKNAAVD